jgi:hypothetical protein
MADTPPPSNSSRLSTPLALPGLRQLTEVSETESEPEPEPEPEPEREYQSLIVIDGASPTTSEPPDQNTNKDADKKISPC